VAVGWRRLHNEELLNLYTSQNIVRVTKSRKMSWAGHVVQMGEIRNAYKISFRKPEGKRPLGRLRHKLENIRMDLREIRWEVVDWFLLAQVRV
jgi:hypothetical protein